MSSHAASESLSATPENASGLIDNSPRKSLNRREFLKLASVFATSIPISNLGRIPGLDTREGVGFWNAVYAVDQLNIDPSSVHLTKKRISSTWNPQLSVEMLSNDTSNFRPTLLKDNPNATVAKIELTFTGKDRQNHLDNINTASHLAAFVIDAAVLSKAVRAFEIGGTAAAISVFSDAEQKFWTKEKKLGLVGGTLALAGMACVITASEINQTQQTTEGIEVTKALTSIPTQGDGTPPPTNNDSGVTLEVTPLPIIPVDFPGKDINVRYLQENGAKIQNPNPEFQPSLTSVPYSGNEQQIDPVEYTKSVFNLSELNTQDSLSVLKYLAAQGPREGTKGGITWYQTGPNGEENSAFAGLAVYREQTQQIEGEYTIGEGYPKGLKIRNGSGISVIGRGNDGNIVISFEEYLEKEGRGSPRLRFAVLPPNEFGILSKNYLDNCKYYLDSPDRISYTNQLDGVGRNVMLNHIDDELMNLIRNESGAIWVDRDINGEYLSQPVVYYPPEEYLQGRNRYEYSYNLITDSALTALGGQFVVAISSDSQYRLYSLYDQEAKNWLWTEGVKLDTWATDSNGQINKEVMAGIVNKALIEDKYAFDMQFGSIKLAIVGDEDLSQADSQTLTDRRNQVKAELESEQGKRCLNQLLQVLPNLRKELNKPDLNFSDCSAIVERDLNGILQLTRILFSDGQTIKLYTAKENGELKWESRIFPMFPELSEENLKFSLVSPMEYDWLPTKYPNRQDSKAIVIEDPTGAFPGEKVFLTEIMTQFQPQDESERQDNRHRPYYPGPNKDPFSPPPPYKLEEEYTGWHLPVTMKASIYFDEIQSDIGINVHQLGPAIAGEGNQIYALAGDYHIPWPGFPEYYTGDSAGMNTLLAQNDGKWYILPMSLEQSTQSMTVGPFTDLNSAIPLKQWVELKTISSEKGVWTLMRVHGQNRYRVMGFVEQHNPPQMPAVSANFGPYALPTVYNFRAFQKDIIVEAYGDRVIIPPLQTP